jgi:hypothetical protein
VKHHTFVYDLSGQAGEVVLLSAYLSAAALASIKRTAIFGFVLPLGRNLSSYDSWVFRRLGVSFFELAPSETIESRLSVALMNALLNSEGLPARFFIHNCSRCLFLVPQMFLKVDESPLIPPDVLIVPPGAKEDVFPSPSIFCVDAYEGDVPKEGTEGESRAKIRAIADDILFGKRDVPRKESKQLTYVPSGGAYVDPDKEFFQAMKKGRLFVDASPERFINFLSFSMEKLQEVGVSLKEYEVPFYRHVGSERVVTTIFQ